LVTKQAKTDPAITPAGTAAQAEMVANEKELTAGAISDAAERARLIDEASALFNDDACAEAEASAAVPDITIKTSGGDYTV
jgi:hypothetical protein